MTEGGEEDSLSLSTLFPSDGRECLPSLSQGKEDDLPSLATLVARADPAVLMGATATDDDADPLETFLATFEGIDPSAVVPPMDCNVDNATATGDLWLAAEAAAASVAGSAELDELPTPSPMPMDDDVGLGGGRSGWQTAASLSALVMVEEVDGSTNGAAALSPASTVAPDVMTAPGPVPAVPAVAALSPVAPTPPVPVAVTVTAPPGASASSLASDSSRVTGAPVRRAAAMAAVTRADVPAAAGSPSAGSAAAADPWTAALTASVGTTAPPARVLSAVERAQQAAEDIAVAEVATRRANAAKAKRARGGGGSGGPTKKRARGAGAGSDGAAEDDNNDGEEEAEAGEAAADAAAGATGSDAEKSRRYQKRLQKNRDSAFVSRIRRRHYTAILETSLKKEEEEKRSLGGEVAQLRSQVEALKAQLVAYRAPATKDGVYGVPSSVVPGIEAPVVHPAGVPPASGSASSTGRCPPSSSAAMTLLPAPLGGRSSPVSSSTSDPPVPYRPPGPTIRTRLGATVASRTAARPAMVTTLLVAAVILGFCVPVAFLPEIASVAAVWAARPLAHWAMRDAAIATFAAGLLPAQPSPPREPVADALLWPKQEQCVPGKEPPWSHRVMRTSLSNDDDGVGGLAGGSDPPSAAPPDSDSERCMLSADAFFDHIFIRDERDATSSSSPATTLVASTGGGGNRGDNIGGPQLRTLTSLSPTSPPRPPVAGPAPADEHPVGPPQPTALSLSLWTKDRGRGSRTPPLGSNVPEPILSPLPRLLPPPATVPQPLGGGGVGGSVGGGGNGGGSGTSAPRPRVRAWSANASDGAAAAAPPLGVGGRVWAAAAWPLGLAGDTAAAADVTAAADTAAPADTAASLHMLCDELASVVDASVGGWPAGSSSEVVNRDPSCSRLAGVTASSSGSGSGSGSSNHCEAVRLGAATASSQLSHARSSYKGKELARPGRVAAWATARVEAALAPGGPLARALTAAAAPEERVLSDVLHLMLLHAYADGAARAKAPAAFAA
ncbi:hypothetical protein MMPV_005918 [Pyropia vietnamensis]